MIMERQARSARPAEGADAPENRHVRFARHSLTVVLVVLLLALTAKVVASDATSATMFLYPFQFDESEGMIVAETMLLDRGVNIFEVPGQELFIAAPYPPLFYLLNWPLQHLAGAEPTFKPGRAISILATLLAGVFIFGITYSLTRDRLAGALGAVAWWSLTLVAYWGSLVKPDMLAVALGLAGLWWVVARPPSQVWWALGFFLAAFFVKQTGIAAGAAVTGWLLLTKPRTGVAFGAAYAAGAIIPSLLLDWWTNGGYFYHMYTLHDLPWFADRFTLFLINCAETYGPLFAPGVIALLVAAAVWLARRLRREPQPLPRDGALLLLLFLGASFLPAVGTGTLGGNHNHLLDLAAACCIGLAMGAALIRQARRWQVQVVGAMLGLFVLAQVPSLFSAPHWLQREFSLLSESKTEGMVNIFQYVTNNGGPAYSDNVGLMLTTGKRLWSTDPYTQTHATFYGRWDESRLVDAIRSRHFSQIILAIDVFDPDPGAGAVSPGILQAVQDSYKLDQRNVLNIYVPR